MIGKILVPSKADARIIYGKIPVPSDDSRGARLNEVNKFKPGIDLNNSKQKFKISPFTKIFEGEGKIALFHSYLMKKIYGGDELKKCLEDIEKNGRGDSKIMKKLIENQFVIPRFFPEQEYKQKFIENFRSFVYDTTPNIHVMYLVLTDRCNLACKYCFIENGALKGNPRYGDMSYEIAKAGVDFFINQLKSSVQKTIIFYGGEPLLNFDIMKKTVTYIREREKMGHFKGRVEIRIVTNASLMTPEMAKFIAEQKITSIVSIDGTREIHNQMRVFPTGKGSFDETVKGYWLLKKAGVQPNIACMIGKHNVDVLDKVVKYFVEELKTRGIGFSLPRLIKGQENLMVPVEKITESIIKAYGVCRKFGVYEDRLWRRRVRPFVEEKFWIRDCAGCGDQIVVLPNGVVGPCHAFLGSLKYFESSVFTKENIENNPIWIEWKKRVPIFMSQCLDCSAISICGGGCPYLAHENSGSIWEVDKEVCVFCNKVLGWLIGELYDKLYKK